MSVIFQNKSHLEKINFDDIPIDSTWNIGDTHELKMHKIHAYPAKFPAFITTKALEYAEKNSVSVNTVADIFCGCGTTAFEAKRNNKNFWGCDINPVATLIAKTKSQTYQNDLIKKYYDEIVAYTKIVNISDKELLTINDRIKYWFFENEIKHLLCIKKAIFEVLPKKNKYHDFFLIAFSNILKPTSKWLTKSIKPQIDPNKKVVDVFKVFQQQVNFMSSANLQSDLQENSTVNIENISFLERNFDDSFVDMIVTSPPYVTSYEYADLHQLSTLWLDYVDDYRALRQGTIGSLYHDVDFNQDAKQLNSTAESIVFNLYNSEKRKAKLVAKYFVDMQKCINKCHQILNKDGLALFIIGNTEYKKVKINNAKHLVESMLDSGFKNINVSRRKITSKILTPYRDTNGKFTTDKNSRQVYSEEFIIIGQK